MATDRKFSTEELSILFDEAPYGVVAIGATGLIEYINPFQCEISRLSRESLVGKHHRSMFCRPLDDAGLLPLYDRLVAEGTPFSATVLDYKRLADGKRVAFTMRGHRSAGWIFLVSGIERLLADQQARYQQLFENANDGIFILSREGKFVAANPRFAEMTGVPIKDLIGQTTEIFLPGRFAESLQRLERIMREGHFGPYELEITTPAGKRFLSLNAFALIEDGKPCGVINVARDMTEEHRIAEELRAARDQALEASRLKTAFLANMSHEVRTPLNVITGVASLIADHLREMGDHSQDELLEGLNRSSKRLIDTMHGVLDLASIESGAFSPKPQRIELCTFVQERIDGFTPEARGKGLSLDLEAEESGAEVRFDPYCLTRVVNNLLDNAIKFTERGGVTVRIHRDESGAVCLCVRDTGAGVDPSYAPHMFEWFSQEEIGYTRRFEGAGIGLALVSHYAKMNQAEISFQSEKNVGTTFTIRFAPAAGAVERGDALAAAPPTIPAPTAATRRPFVLAVEDDDLTQGLLAVTLRGDFDVLHAASAEEARARLAAHPDVAVVLVDLSLEGDEDGLMLTRWMRSEPRWREVPIIATTAHAMPSDRQNALQAGCTAYLAKPISPAELRSAIRRLLPDG